VTRYTGAVAVGDVLITREGPWWVSAAIRFGAWLAGTPAFCNHAIIVHHQNPDGTWIGIEGKPGGVDWRDLTGPLTWTLTNANNAQPKTEAQRYLIAKASESLLHAVYDWDAIVTDAQTAARWIWHKAREWQPGEIPSAVVCSSFADWAYEQVGLANPGGPEVTRMTTPGDWDRFIQDEEWTK
jgi:hypothetical protein